MEFDLKILVPLLGVFLGWILATITSISKERLSNKKLLSKSIAQLYYLIHEFSIVKNYLDKVKTDFPTEKYEEHRQKIIERHTLKNDESILKINELIDNISSLSPMLGIDIKYLLESYVFDRKVKFDSSKKKENLYYILLSVLEVHQDLILAELKKILVKLAFKYNLIVGLKIRKKLKKGESNLESESQKIFDMLDNEIKEKPVHNKV